MRITTLLVAASSFACGTAATADPVPISVLYGVNYFTVTAGGSGDFQTQCCSSRPNMVASTLGPNRRPVFTPDGGPAITGVDAMTGEIQWWTPGVTNGGDTVIFSGVDLVSDSFSDTSFFPPDGTGADNANGFLTAFFTGNLTLDRGTIITANVGADDDAFVFIDEQLVSGLGGVHAVTLAPQGSIFLPAGTYSVDVFFADRFRTQSSLEFSLTGEAIPEPATWAMLIAGFGLIGAAVRRRRAVAA